MRRASTFFIATAVYVVILMAGFTAWIAFITLCVKIARAWGWL